MVRINLNNGYYVDQDRLNYILRQDYINANGKPATRTVGYFGGIKQLIEKYLEQCQKDFKDCEAMEMCEYVKMIEESNKQAVSGLKSVLEEYAHK